MLTSATREETLTPNPNECNSMLTSGTRGIYPYLYIAWIYSGNGRWERAKTSKLWAFKYDFSVFQ